MLNEAARNVFQDELKAAEDSLRILESGQVTTKDYRALSDAYQKLLKKSGKIVIIGDRTQNKLVKISKRLEETLKALKEAQDKLVCQERLSALDQMARGVAHDFNNALQPIIIAAGLPRVDPKVLENSALMSQCFDTIQQAAENAAETVQRLIHFYTPSWNSVEVLIDLGPLIANVVVFTKPKWKIEALAHGKMIELTTDLAPDCWIRGFRDEMREVFVNLIFNAENAIVRKGEISISLRREADSVVVEVRDTGRGMIEDVRAKCLEPFFTTQKQSGTGLGLSIVYGIIKRHHGQLDVESVEGRGSVFRIRLPGQQGERTSTDMGEELFTADESWQPALAPGNPEAEATHILIAEDDVPLRNMIANTLRYMGYLVTAVSNGREAWNVLRESEIDVLVTDHAMPEMTGQALAAKVKREMEHIPVLMLTGFGDLMRAQENINQIVDLLLTKPVQPRKLEKAIRELLRKKGGIPRHIP